MGIKAATSAHIALRKNLSKSTEFTLIFEQLKSLVINYQALMKISVNSDSRFEIWTEREISFNGKKPKKGVMFATLLKLRNFVGLYFQPLYFDNKLIDDESFSELVGKKTGLTCFHFTSLNSTLLAQTESLFNKGLEFYQNKNWV